MDTEKSLSPSAEVDILEPTETRRMRVNVGPSHPAMHGVIQIVVEVEGETIVYSDTNFGYLHRGFEKECENHTYQLCIPYTDRLNYVSPLINNEGFCLAIEKFFGVDVPERCKYIRTMLSELSRISDHQTCIGAAAMELGAFTPFLYLMKGRELIYRILEEVTGHRLTINYMRPGGLAADLPEGFFEHLRDILPVIREVTSETDKLLTKNRIFIDRTRNVGAISKEDALSFSYSGPCLRACGMAYDVRKAFPYSAYDRVDFEVPVGSAGDTLDRYLVRMAEMEQSVRIIEQCMRQIPDGPVSVNDPRVILPPKQEVYHTIEGLVNHFKLVYEGIRPPKGEVYQMVEGGNGELGYYIVSDGTGRPYRVRVRPPCFMIVSSMDFMIKGAMMADIVPVFGSLNMIAGEMER